MIRSSIAISRSFPNGHESSNNLFLKENLIHAYGLIRINEWRFDQNEGAKKRAGKMLTLPSNDGTKEVL